MTRSSKVLIVDDDEECRNTLGEVLTEEGCTVRTASDGRRALEVLQAFRPNLVVVDLMMPVMNGWDFCDALDRDPTLADIPVVIVSAVARFRPAGRKSVLAKPLRLDSLLALIDLVHVA